LITYLHLVPRITTDVATSALPHIPARRARGSVTLLSRAVGSKTSAKSANPQIIDSPSPQETMFSVFLVFYFQKHCNRNRFFSSAPSTPFTIWL